MKNSHKSELFRKMTPNSLSYVSMRKPSHLSKSKEFFNYKPISTLDSPIDCEPIEVEAYKAYSLPLPEFIELPHPPILVIDVLIIDYQYISRGKKSAKEHKKTLNKLSYNRSIPFTLKLKKQLFLDLDESIVHTYIDDFKKKEADIHMEQSMFISHRPYLPTFLKRVSKFYDIIVQL